MKLYKTIILASATLIAVASCGKLNQRPVFNPADSFAAFDKASMSATEEAGVVKIPVTIASIDPIATTVTYSVDVENSTAVEGTHFNLVDPSAVLSFANDARTAYIELEIIPVRGEAGYTGDKVIYLELTGSNDVNMGSNKVCKFTINDLDHPLSAILGEYVVNGSATITLEKDPTDVSVIHVYDIFPATQSFIGSEGKVHLIGQVSKDLSTIVIPLPADTGYTYSNGNNFMIYALDGEYVLFDVASITLVKTPTGYVCEDYGLIAYIKGAGGVGDYFMPPFTLVKK